MDPLALPMMLRTTLRGGMLRGTSPTGVARLLRQAAMGRRDLFLTLSKHAWEHPDQVVVQDAHGELTNRQLHRGAQALAIGLELQPGQRVAVVLDNRAAWFLAMAGVFEAGAVPLPFSPSYAPQQLCEKLAGAAVELAIVEPRLLDAASRSCQAIAADGPAWTQLLGTPLKRRWPLRLGSSADMVMHTSGTTGRSKGTRIDTRAASLDTFFLYLDRFDLRRGDRLYTPCPLYHAAPMLLSGLALTAGASVVARPDFSDAPAILPTVSHAFLVPTLLERMARWEQAPAMPSLRALISGGAALRPRTKLALLARYGPVLYDFYGATELGVVSLATPSDLADHPQSVGRVLPGVEVMLVDDDGKPVRDDSPGELYVRSSLVSPGYEGVRESDPLLADGWRSAGDVARLDGDRLTIVDRKRDVVISGGVNLFPAEIEERLEEHPAVREAACVGVADAEWGEALHAFAVLEAPLSQEEMKEFMRQRVQKQAVPKVLHVVDEIPRSATGKVLRRSLRERI